MCCGQRRQANRAWLAPRPVWLRYVGPGAVNARGSATGTIYRVSKQSPNLKVDPRDAAELMKSGQFVAAR
jgi:hypothetical protein